MQRAPQLDESRDARQQRNEVDSDRSHSRFPIPDSRFPIPDSRFTIRRRLPHRQVLDPIPVHLDADSRACPAPPSCRARVIVHSGVTMSRSQ